MVAYKLTYFNVMGLGEPIRLLLSYAGQEFEDVRIFDRENEWPRLKTSTPFGQLPTLEIDGTVYAQTLPICRYLAKQYNLIGESDLDALKIDSIANALHDLRKQFGLFYREADPKLKAIKKEEVLKNTLPFYLNRLEETVIQNGGYFHGGKLSYADIFFVGILDSMSNASGYDDILEKYPNLRKLQQQVLQNPGIKKWMEKRPKLEF